LKVPFLVRFDTRVCEPGIGKSRAAVLVPGREGEREGERERERRESERVKERESETTEHHL
jgi:hypothetical protein